MELQFQMPRFTRPHYPTEVSDEEWAFVLSYLSLYRPNAPLRTHDVREIFNAVRCMVKPGAQGRYMPQRFPRGRPALSTLQIEVAVHDFRQAEHAKQLGIGVREALSLEGFDRRLDVVGVHH